MNKLNNLDLVTKNKSTSELEPEVIKVPLSTDCVEVDAEFEPLSNIVTIDIMSPCWPALALRKEMAKTLKELQLINVKRWRVIANIEPLTEDQLQQISLDPPITGNHNDPFMTPIALVVIDLLSIDNFGMELLEDEDKKIVGYILAKILSPIYNHGAFKLESSEIIPTILKHAHHVAATDLVNKYCHEMVILYTFLDNAAEAELELEDEHLDYIDE
jgi:hypothetical protein